VTVVTVSSELVSTGAEAVTRYAHQGTPGNAKGRLNQQKKLFRGSRKVRMAGGQNSPVIGSIGWSAGKRQNRPRLFR
jgi:hypothetical protein